ncbi:hypothetical protein VTK73DRAFT_3725 [Phialemonium thermophilum]|uniref:Uncharacterized protein n=1 Tax=Phialemonium thermophilum TaxID=223376 RepID=A0ABR3VFK1_9PEZI
MTFISSLRPLRRIRRRTRPSSTCRSGRTCIETPPAGGASPSSSSSLSASRSASPAGRTPVPEAERREVFRTMGVSPVEATAGGLAAVARGPGSEKRTRFRGLGFRAGVAAAMELPPRERRPEEEEGRGSCGTSPPLWGRPAGASVGPDELRRGVLRRAMGSSRSSDMAEGGVQQQQANESSAERPEDVERDLLVVHLVVPKSRRMTKLVRRTG